MPPVTADLDSDLWRLRAELTEKKKAASKAWAAFEKFRQEHKSEILHDRGDAFDRAKALQKVYDRAAAEIEELEPKMMAAFDRQAFGKARGGPGEEFGRLDGIADAFAKTLSPTGEASGLKAITTGGSIVPPFFMSASVSCRCASASSARSSRSSRRRVATPIRTSESRSGRSPRLRSPPAP